MIVLLLFALGGRPSSSPYMVCAAGVRWYCRHIGSLETQPNCVSLNARQCGHCEVLAWMRPKSELGSCREWLDGSLWRNLRRLRREAQR